MGASITDFNFYCTLFYSSVSHQEDTHFARTFSQVLDAVTILQVLNVALLTELHVSNHFIDSLWHLVTASCLLYTRLPEVIGVRHIAFAALHLHHLIDLGLHAVSLITLLTALRLLYVFDEALHALLQHIEVAVAIIDTAFHA